MRRQLFIGVIALLLSCFQSGCRSKEKIIIKEEKVKKPIEKKASQEVETQFAAWKRVEEQLKKIKRVKLKWKKELLDEKQKKMLSKLLQAAYVMDELFLRQVCLRNRQIKIDLEKTKDPKRDIIRRYFNINFGPYDRFDNNRRFIKVPPKRPGATFYPANMSKQEFEQWIKDHPEDREAFVNSFTIIKRVKGGLAAVKYSDHYREELEKAARYLKEAASYCENRSLARYLNSRAKAFLTNDYYQSDIDWLNVKGNLVDVTIGPYETYEDRLFGYKAAFEAFICLKDPEESSRLEKIKSYLPEMEKALPLDEEYKKSIPPKVSPISVVDVIYTAGDARAGVQTIAFNLPNDEAIRQKKGSKKVLLRNLIEAKYSAVLVPLSKRVIHPDQLKYVTKDEFFNHVLLHEMSHGMGPGIIEKNGKKTEVKIELKDLYSAIEEAKADVLAMVNSVFLEKNRFYPEGISKKMWVTFLASIFRSIRFGIDEAHGRANIIILNYLKARGGYEYDEKSATFRVNFDKIQEAVMALAREILTIQATGDYARARSFTTKYGHYSDEIKRVIDKLKDVPVDIEPVFDLNFEQGSHLI